MGEKHDELVPADASHRVVAAHGSVETLGDRLEQLVSRLVAQGVVYVLKVVEVEEEDAEPPAAPVSRGHGHAHAVL